MHRCCNYEIKMECKKLKDEILSIFYVVNELIQFLAINKIFDHITYLGHLKIYDLKYPKLI